MGFGGRARSAPEAPDPEELAAFELNDYGNAMRLVRLVGGWIDRATGAVDPTHCELLYLRQRGWIAFNGQYWDLDRGEHLAKRAAVRVAQGLVEQMKIRADDMCTEDDGAPKKEIPKRAIGELYDFARGCGNNSRLTSMLKVAQDYLDVELDDFDQDPLVLNVQNGTVRFLPGGPDSAPSAVFSEGHRAADRLTRICRVDYKPRAEAPTFLRSLEASQPQPHMRDCLQRALGYAITGSQDEQVFMVLQGKGGDGKSTLIGACRHALGTYALGVAIETFLDTGVKRGADASPDIARLAGDSRFVCTGEPPPNAALNTGMIKKFTGGGTVEARELRQSIFEFEPRGKVILECNRRPDIDDADDGIWRRLLFIPFSRQIPADQVDDKLKHKLKAEGEGVLVWLIQGVLKWLGDGLTKPQEVLDMLDDYRNGSNPFAIWLRERVIIEPGAEVGSTALYTDYKAFVEERGGDKPWSQKRFAKELGSLQIIAVKNGAGNMVRRGARLRQISDLGGPSAPAAFDDPDDDPYGGAR